MPFIKIKKLSYAKLCINTEPFFLYIQFVTIVYELILLSLSFICQLLYVFVIPNLIVIIATYNNIVIN